MNTELKKKKKKEKKNRFQWFEKKEKKKKKNFTKAKLIIVIPAATARIGGEEWGRAVPRTVVNWDAPRTTKPTSFWIHFFLFLF